MPKSKPGLPPPLLPQSLKRRMISSYMIVTVISTIVIELILTLLLIYKASWSDSQLRLQASGTIQRIARVQDAFDFTNGKIDPSRLKRWMDAQMSVVNVEYKHPFPQKPFIASIQIPVRNSQMVICTTRGVVLAMTPAYSFQTNTSLLVQLSKEEHEIWEEAHQGRPVARHVCARIVVAVPLGVRHGRPSAIALYRTSPIYTQYDLLGLFVLGELPKAIEVIVFSTLISGCLGALTAKRLIRRFEAIAHVADDWSRGSFAMTAPETPRDELGQLGRRLNFMAADLHSFITLRRELAAVEERNRIARDLHDTVKQHVFAAGMQIGAMRAYLASKDEAGAMQSLNELEQLTRQMRTDLTDILNELRPFEGGEGGAAEAIRRLVADWSRQSGIEATCSIMRSSPLSATMTREFYLVTQEALANIARHSGASQVSVAFQEEAEILTLEIADNGKGFFPAMRSAGFGLYTMRERAESLPDGSIEIGSAPGKGTCITVRCRLETSKEKAVA